jgi:hypothetical protein
MHVRDLLIEIAERGITLTCGSIENRLNAKPTKALTPMLIAEIKEHKAEIIALMHEDERRREDRRLQESGVIQSERQVFEMAHAYFGGRVQRKGKSNNAEVRAHSLHRWVP